MNDSRIISLIAPLILGLMGVLSANETPIDPIKTIGPAMIRAAEAKNSFLDALETAKNEGDIAKIAVSIDQIAEAMTVIAAEAGKAKPLTSVQKRELRAIGERREYELFQDRSMESAMEKIPADFQPKVIALLESRKEQMAAIEEVHDRALATKDRESSHSAQALWLLLEPPFQAAISFGNATDALKDPLQFVTVTVTALNQADQSSLILYEQEADWRGPAPDAETLKSWIKWDEKERKVEFVLPGARFEYRLPQVAKP